jgi:hypothetical protein
MALMLVLAASGAAEPFSYMRKPEPDALYCMASVGDNCPVDDATVHRLIDDVARRFSLTRLDKAADGEPLFYVELYCHRQQNGETAYSVETGFAEWVGREQQHLMKYAYYPYRSVGYGGALDIRDTVRRRIEDALSDYLDANFPRGETRPAGPDQ